MPLPIPRLAPVTTAILPFKSVISIPIPIFERRCSGASRSDPHLTIQDREGDRSRSGCAADPVAWSVSDLVSGLTFGGCNGNCSIAPADLAAMTISLRTPVLVGCAQLTRPSMDASGLIDAAAIEPLRMMESAAHVAAEDAGALGLLEKIDSIRIPQGVWRYSNPAYQLGKRLGCRGFETGLAPISGSSVQIMLSRAAEEIQQGLRDVVLLASSECGHWTRRQKKEGGAIPEWAHFGGFDPQEGSGDVPAPDQRFGGEEMQVGWWERKYHVQAIQGFALYENAMRYQKSEGLDEHRKRITSLWARFAEVARDNPSAWIRSAPSAEVIGAAAGDNRMVSYPYTKLMVANISVNQSAALLLCSYEMAMQLGVSEDRMIFPHASAETTRTHEISHRPDFYSQPAIGLVGKKVSELAGCRCDEIEHVDLYSCFPAAVQMAAAELGLSLDRELTVTGGLTFSGGPLNSYVMHSIAGMMQRLRARREAGHIERGLVSSIGGFIAKHALSIYGAGPPGPRGFQHACVDDASMALPKRELARDCEGPAVVETFAVMGAAGAGPHHLLLSCGIATGARVWAECHDPDIVTSVEREELCGRRVDVSADGVATFQ